MQVGAGLGVVTLTAALLSGCVSRIQFTHSMRQGLRASTTEEAAEVQPGSFQYYVSRRIVLERALSSRKERIARGRIVLRKGRLLEQVIVRRGTPGIALDWGPDWIDVSFADGTALRFAHNPKTGHDSHGDPDLWEQRSLDGVYRLQATRKTGVGSVVEFDGGQWTPSGTTMSAYLLIKRNSLTTHHRRRKILRGRRL